MLKVGWIDYANCTPLLLQIEQELTTAGIGLVHGVPAQLNQALAKGDVDICISSSIEYATHQDDYAILPGHCIGCSGPVMSVLLFSHRPVEELGNSKILVTPESATSLILLKILLSEYWKLEGSVFEPSQSDWETAISSGEPLLLIGDSALKASMSSIAPYCYDLGEVWSKMTGLPFVYALWQINRHSAASKGEEISLLTALLDRARDMVPENIEQLAVTAAEKSWMGQEHLEEYWRKITYNLDEAHIKGLTHFYSLAAGMKLVPAVGFLDFYRAQ